MTKKLHVLAVEPYYGGSHRAFLDSVVRHSRHQWSLVTAPARNWKWRMRSAPLLLASQATAAIDREESNPDVVFCTDMLDVTSWLGLVSRIDTPSAKAAVDAPLMFYFHENQWTYPASPSSRPDHHYGYTNLTSAIAADVCCFNSAFHLESFLRASEDFLARMRDSKDAHDLVALRQNSMILYPGFDLDDHCIEQATTQSQYATDASTSPLRIGWVSRWEYDKRPDEFLRLLCMLESQQVLFDLVLLGERSHKNDSLNEIRQRFGRQIIVDEFAPTREQYIERLGQMDVVVSTADHEFFGIAVCEAIACGAVPVLPNRLSYPELVPDNDRFESIEHAAELIQKLIDLPTRSTASRTAKQSMEKFKAKCVVQQIDDVVSNLAKASGR